MFKTKSKAVMKQTADHKKVRSSSQQGTRVDSLEAQGAETPIMEENSPSPLNDRTAERFKRIAETTKVTALKRFMITKGNESDDERQREVTPEHQNSKVWDMDLADMELKQKHSSLGMKHVRIVLPTPEMQCIIVKRKADTPPSGCITVGVLRSVKANLEIRSLNTTEDFRGPRCTEKGEIIPHTLLGDVQSFLSEAERRGEFKELREQKRMATRVVASVKQSPGIPWNPLLNESNALKSWAREMQLRRLEQKRLAGILHREEGQLIMCKSDQHVRKEELRRFVQNADEPQHPEVCFWRLPERLGQREICPTFTKSEQGQLTTAVISGDADSVVRQKGKAFDPSTGTWLQSDYLKKRDQQLGGVIHVKNSLCGTHIYQSFASCVDPDRRAPPLNRLFDKLEVAGAAVYPPKQISSLCSLAAGDKGNNSGDVMSYLMPPDAAECFSQGDNSRGLNSGNGARSVEQSTRGQLSHCIEEDSEQRPATWFGPALYIDGVTLRWHGSGDASSRHGNRVIKETFVLVESAVGEVVRSRVEITNCGSTAIQYNWKKMPVIGTLPVSRLKRRPFYFMADEGVILPRQTIQVPLLFRSKIPGYFSEAWCLTTVPEIEGGAVIKFTFKGVARGVQDFSSQCLAVETYLHRNQVRSLCEFEARRVVELSSLKASLEEGGHQEDPEHTSLEKLFQLENPGMYYHENVIHRLALLYNTVTMDINADRERETAGIYCPNNVLSVSRLRRVLLDIPCEESTEEDDSYGEITLQQSLLCQFNQEVSLLMFRPLIPVNEPGCLRYCITYSLLLYGLDSVVVHAINLSHKLGMILAPEEEKGCHENSDSRSSKEKKGALKPNQKGKAIKTKPTKGTPSRGTSPIQRNSASPETKHEPVVYSAMYKYRTVNAGSPTLLQYDEKVYLKMYTMLENTIDTIFDLFSH